MQALTLQEMAAAMSGKLRGNISVPTATRISTDSRGSVADSLFFAIIGERFDGHAYVNEALAKGASAAVVSDVSKVDAQYHTSGRLIQVNNTVDALGRLAAWYRRQFAAQVIAVIGSNGKTTTKDLINRVLGSRKRGRAGQASFNNAIGVPLTLLSVEPQDEFVVVEIGTNHPGEIAALGRIVQPDLAVITSIGEEHLEFFGDVQSVAREEFSLLPCMRHRGFVAMSDQAAEFAPAKAAADCTVLKYGLSEAADLRAVGLQVNADGQRFKVNNRFDYHLPLLGKHNVANALAAIAIGTRFRLTHEEIASALRGAQASPMRMERFELGGITLINDAYNANPSSVRAALEVLDQMSSIGRKVLILGDMRELGGEAVRCHQAVGREVGRSTAQIIIAVGAMARVLTDGATAVAGTAKRIYAFPSVEAVAEKIGTFVQPGDVVLLKASRAVRLERLLANIEEIARSAAAK
ncbi:MAG TPA: UDP-N-acetylmuramoyl-tripeptide--D-alanyl-D-alanine ligase [Phycisphaerae bacterium]|nr:UDP-N-acetylmuramoyl-tripeptide--D-alanyl-D-alanine ligase [Phycisphaerae bacterium]